MNEYKLDPLPFDELLSLPTISNPNLSKNKDKLAFYWDKTGRIELYVMDINTKEITQISNGELPRAPRTGFTWDKEGKKIFFGKDTGGNEQNDIWVFDIEKKEAKALTNTPDFQEHVGSVSNDNQWLTFMSTKSGQMNVFKMKLDGTEITQLSASDVPVMGGKWSPDDKWIVMATNEMRTNLRNDDIYLFNTETNDMKRIIRMDEEGSKESFSDWHPDSKMFTFQSDASGLNKVGLYDMETEEITWLSDGQKDENGGTFSPSGEYVVVLQNHEATIHPILYNVKTKERKELKIPSGLAFNTKFINDDKLLFYFTSPQIKNDIWIYDITKDTYEVLIESDYGSIEKSKFIVPEYIKYDSFDGLEIPAVVYKPKNMTEKELYRGSRKVAK